MHLANCSLTLFRPMRLFSTVGDHLTTLFHYKANFIIKQYKLLKDLCAHSSQ